MIPLRKGYIKKADDVPAGVETKSICLDIGSYKVKVKRYSTGLYCDDRLSSVRKAAYF